MTTLLPGGATRSREALDDDVDLARDRALVTRAQAGDRTAFDDLYVRYYRRLYRFCLRRLHDGYEAEDVAQESFARAWRALPNFAGDRRFYPWLSVIAAHLCTDVLRRRNRSTPVAEFHQNNVASTEDGGEELMIAAVDSDLVARAFQRLSDRHQRILNLREGSGWSYQRIADHEGVGITAVETLLWRARQALKREFAALAGAEGRIAGWIGGFLSLATLRRMLRLPMHAAKRLAHLGHGAQALAMGSAAAATAMVAAATMSGPTASPVNQGPPSGPAAGGVAAASAAPTHSPQAAPDTSSGASGPSSPEQPGATSDGAGNSASGAVGEASGAIGGTAGALSGTGGPLNGTVDGATEGVSQIVLGTTGALGQIVHTITSALDPADSQIAPILGPAATTLNGAAVALGSTSQQVSGDTSGVVGDVAKDATTGLDRAGASPSTDSPSVCSTHSVLGAVLGCS